MSQHVFGRISHVQLMAFRREARNAALDEAARVAEGYSETLLPNQPITGTGIAATIRALKDKPEGVARGE